MIPPLWLSPELPETTVSWARLSGKDEADGDANGAETGSLPGAVDVIPVPSLSPELPETTVSWTWVSGRDGAEVVRLAGEGPC